MDYVFYYKWNNKLQEH